MNILLLGSGGREHALAWKIRQSPQTNCLFIAPGNGGTAIEGTNVPLVATDFPAIAEFALSHAIDRIVVGPEEPLTKGIYDFFNNNPTLQHIAVIGPSRAGAQLEGSKCFAKAFMQRHRIPTAQYRSLTTDKTKDILPFLERLHPPYVVKADGLAAGKGVVIADNPDEALSTLQQMADGLFGDAGKKAVVEEYLNGIECSLFVATDGLHYKILPVAKDYKRIGEGNTGPNTGGMGAISPVLFANDNFIKKTEERIVRPTIKGLQSEGILYKGFLFIGLMNVHGEPFALEYNCRLGDPETQAIVRRINNDWVELMESILRGDLDKQTIVEDPRTAAVVVLCSDGYPTHYQTGQTITGLDQSLPQDVVVFHAGTQRQGEQLLTAGGRVMAISACDTNKNNALTKCYQTADLLHFHNMYFRRDIGHDL